MKRMFVLIPTVLILLLGTGCSTARGYNQTSVGQVEQIYRGSVISVKQVSIKDSGAGTILGAIVGGVAGNQFGPRGSGEKTAATVIGALGGAYAGNQVNKDSGQELIIALNDGRQIRTVHRVDRNTPYSLRTGDPVIVYYRGGRISEVKLDSSYSQPQRQQTPTATQFAPQRYQSAPQTAPSSSMNTDKIQKLKELGALRQQGILTEEEFQMEKRKILNGTY